MAEPEALLAYWSPQTLMFTLLILPVLKSPVAREVLLTKGLSKVIAFLEEVGEPNSSELLQLANIIAVAARR